MSRQLHELFLASCGVYGQWTLRISRTEAVVEERSFTTPFAFVGSREGSCLRLEDAAVSRRHAYFQVVPGGLFCIDLGSRTGLRWGDEVREAGWLRPGTQVRVGPFALELLATNQDAWFVPLNWPPGDPLAERANETAGLRPFVVEIADGDKLLAHGKMNRVIALVGRSTRCLFHIEHPSLSKFHGSLVRTPMGLWVIDLVGSKGVQLNGRRVRCARVHEGDVLQAGKYSLRLRNPRGGARPAAPAAQGAVVVRQAGDTRSTVLVRPGPDDKKPGELVPQPPLQTLGSAVEPRAAPVLPAVEGVGPEWSMLIALVNQFNLMQQQMLDQFQESIVTTSRLFSSLQKDQMAVVSTELDQLRALTGELRALQEELSARRTKVKPPAPVRKSAKNGEPRTPRPAASGPPAEARSDLVPPQGASPEEIHLWLNQRIANLQEERQSRWHKLLGMILGN